MNVIRPNDNKVICEDCGAILGYTGQDLRQGACSYYIECPVCGKMHLYIVENHISSAIRYRCYN